MTSSPYAWLHPAAQRKAAQKARRGPPPPPPVFCGGPPGGRGGGWGGGGGGAGDPPPPQHTEDVFFPFSLYFSPPPPPRAPPKTKKKRAGYGPATRRKRRRSVRTPHLTPGIRHRRDCAPQAFESTRIGQNRSLPEKTPCAGDLGAQHDGHGTGIQQFRPMQRAECGLISPDSTSAKPRLDSRRRIPEHWSTLRPVTPGKERSETGELSATEMILRTRFISNTFRAGGLSLAAEAAFQNPRTISLVGCELPPWPPTMCPAFLDETATRAIPGSTRSQGRCRISSFGDHTCFRNAGSTTRQNSTHTPYLITVRPLHCQHAASPPPRSHSSISRLVLQRRRSK